MIPDFQTLMLPFLRLLSDAKEHSLQDVYDTLCEEFHLTDEEKRTVLAKSNQSVIRNRIGWVRTYLLKAGLITSPQRAVYKVSQDGLNVLAKKPKRIDISYLRQIPKFQQWRETFSSHKENVGNDETSLPDVGKTPEELLDDAYVKLKSELADELLNRITKCSPAFFERLVIDLLLHMGYGGSQQEAGQVTGKTGDGGIDGIIKEDKLGLDTIYIQAKKWQDGNTVGRPDIQKFVGALAEQGAKKGVFITTSSFTEAARKCIPKNDTKIVLIDGLMLAELMIEYNVGLSVKTNYEVKRIDSDYFEEE